MEAKVKRHGKPGQKEDQEANQEEMRNLAGDQTVWDLEQDTSKLETENGQLPEIQRGPIGLHAPPRKQKGRRSDFQLLDTHTAIITK